MRISYKRGMLDICETLAKAQENASNHSNSAIRAAILDGAIDVALCKKDLLIGNVIYCDTDSIKIKEDTKQ